ncbi:hypothetical protein B0H19DRAFT_1265828 [Mycena capillaripes]|nr:hypothetical protein B0H19DRAFT_1265828 [Mycena capillaripes]
MSEFAIDIGKLTIPLFLGTLINWALLGALVVQFYLYFIAFPKDQKRFKAFVVLIFIAEILQTLSDTHDTIRTFGSGYGNWDLLDVVGWSFFSVPIIGSIIACGGQIFFAWRIYIISRSLVIPVIIAVITSFQLGAGIWTGVEIGRAQRFSLLKFDYFKAPVAWLSATAACDLLIVASTCYYLLKSGRLGFHRSTDRIVSRIIKVTVETGLFCALFALLDLALFIRYNGNNYHLAVCIELSKVYSNSIMIILNSRAHIGHKPPTNETHVLQHSEVVFGTGPTATTTVQGSVYPTDTQKYDVGFAV